MSCSSTLSPVIVLIPGRGADSPRGVTGTVTLVRTDDLVLLVDAGDPWNGQEIVTSLKENEISPEQVTHVVITHGHLDHCANLPLFQNAKILMDSDIAVRKDNSVEYSSVTEWPHQISEHVKVFKYSGHTHSDLLVEVIDERNRKILICGDLVESETDRGLENAVDADKLVDTQRIIFESADIIVPGHGDLFVNLPETFSSF